MHNHAVWMEHPERGSVLLMRVLVRIALHAGRRVTRILLFPICLYFFLFSPSALKAVRTYLTRAKNHRPNAFDLFHHLFVFATTQLDRVYFLNGQSDLFDIRVHGEKELVDLLGLGQGCFLMGAHLGSFEVLRIRGFQQSGIHVSTLMFKEHAHKINSLLHMINPEAPYEIIPSGRIDSMFKVHEQVDRGGCIGILADRSLNENATRRLSFLEAPADFPLGPFRLATMLGRPMVFMVGLFRGGNRYDIYFERISCTKKNTSKDMAEQALVDYVQRLEHYCRLAPYNWFNFYEFWAHDNTCVKGDAARIH
uniref:Acyl-CoA synthetase n=1 Tax=Leptospirillum ferriphilum TaxID=178606 RepID=A0A7C3LRT5_9BACT